MKSKGDFQDGSSHYSYRAHGLGVRSNFPLPELIPAPGLREHELSISSDNLADRAMDLALEPAARTGCRSSQREQGEDAFSGGSELLLVPEGGAAFRVSDVATFWVRGGARIHVTPATEADPKAITLFTLGSAISLALLQRGALVLHGAGVVTDGRAVLFLGPSGAGKSTLAAGCAHAGINALGDDTIALWPVGGGEDFVVYPSIQSFKLWKDALEEAGIGQDGLLSVVNRYDKFYLPNPRTAPDTPHHLRQIFLIVRDPSEESSSIEPLGFLEALQGLTANVYRPEFVETLELTAPHFRQLSKLADQIPVARLLRPWTHAGNNELIASLLERSDGGQIISSGD